MPTSEPEPAPEARPVSAAHLAEALAPYRAESRYLRSAHVATRPAQRPLAEITGRFAIGSSCYITDTGHFNSVEFNLCHRQLVNVLLRDERVRELLPDLSGVVPAVKIRRLASAFRRAMSSRDFFGRLLLLAAARRGDVVRIDTEVRFWTRGGGHCEGTAVLETTTGRAANAKERRP